MKGPLSRRSENASYEPALAIAYTHNFTALEGNSLTLMKTKEAPGEHLSVDDKQLWKCKRGLTISMLRKVSPGDATEQKAVKGIYILLIVNILPEAA